MPKGFTSQGAVQGNNYDHGGSSGNGGGNRGGGSGNGSGGGGSGDNGGDGPRMTTTRAELQEQRKFTEDFLNLLDANAQYNLRATNDLNKLGTEEARKAGKPYITEYLPNSYDYRGPRNSQPDDLPLLRFHSREGTPQGRWHGSIQDAERNLGLQFNKQSTENSKTAVQIFILGYALPSDFLPEHSQFKAEFFSEARAKPSISQVAISRTVYGRQQANIDPADVNYSETKPIHELFERIKFKL